MPRYVTGWGNNMLSLSLPPIVHDTLARWASRAYPNECCGLLIGRSTGPARAVAQVTQARNLVTERSRDRFELDPADLLEADRCARAAGLDVIGIWHTHPDHPARPSATDLAHAWPQWSYVIVSVGPHGIHELRSWRLDGAAFAEEEVLS